MAEAARAEVDLQGWVEWLQLAVSTAEVSGAPRLAALRRLLEQATRHHDEAALRYGRFSASDSQLTGLMRIRPFNTTLARTSGPRVRRWQRAWADFLAHFPMFSDSPRGALQQLDRVAWRGRIAEQCAQLPGSPHIVPSTSLTCRHLTRQLPHLRLGPAKLEQLSLEPGVAALHDFVSAAECAQLRARGRGRMKATPLTLPTGLGGQYGSEEYTDKRMSKIRYLSHRGDTLAASLNTRTSLALGLDLDGSPLPAENYQLMNYGIGRWQWWW